MNKILFLTCFHLGICGFLGFLVTLLFGFLAYNVGFSINLFYIALIVFAAVAVTISVVCIVQCSRKLKNCN